MSDASCFSFRVPAWMGALAAGLLFGMLTSFQAGAQTLQLPTSNRALFEKGGMEKFFAPTPGRSWESGAFGCVRSDGWQMHEGIDIRSQQRDKNGEPTDPVMATGDGVVAYVNARAALSNYGKYVVIQHFIEGLEIYSLYAHLGDVRSGIKRGQRVRAGEVIAIMGRTANTRSQITKDRAHVHFELDFFINDSFSTWFKQKSPGERNDHGMWNGQNMVGIDPRLAFLQQERQGRDFSLLNFVRGQTELYRVLVRKTDFPWLRRYRPLVLNNPAAAREPVAGYEISFNYNGLPFKLLPRTAGEMRTVKSRDKFLLLSVNDREYNNCHCRKLIHQKSGRWELASNGLKLLELLTY